MSDELLNIFWIEVSEHLETLNGGMLQLEMLDPEDKDTFGTLVQEMNRVAHSMKGAARAVGVSVIENLSHHLEEIFGAAQQHKIEITPDVADTVYDSLDLIQEVANSEEPNQEALAITLSRLEQLVEIVGNPNTGNQEMHVVTVKGNNGKASSSSPAAEIRDVVESPVPDLAQTLPEQPPTPTPAKAAQKPVDTSSLDTSTLLVRPAEETVRVTVGKLDELMAEVTELFVAQMHREELHRAITDLRRTHSKWQREWRSVRAAYIRLVRRLQDQDEEVNSELPIIFRFLESNQRRLTESTRQLNQIAQSMGQENMRMAALADQLQDDISGMRLVPFESIVGVFQRMIRDLGRDINKQIQFEVQGGHVEIDKAVLDSLKDPLMHLLRNSVDHGIETPEQRESSGKPPTGHIQIEVKQRGSEIVINVWDDGKGIDADVVRRSVVRHGLLTETEAAALTDDDARIYIFYSGLTTTDHVTSISGRGLGMDIVRDRIEGLRGRVSVQSEVGKGTTISLSVPVSLTRIRCIMFEVGDQLFAIPSAMVARMGTTNREKIFRAEGRDMIEIADKPILVSSMGAVLSVASAASEDEDLIRYVTLQATDRMVMFEVDHLLSETELVLKPLGPELSRARYVAGAALLGDGGVVIILDANDLVRQATGATLPRRVAPKASNPAERQLRVLVADDSITTRTLEKNILETAGFDVYVATDGQEAWAMLPTNDFDIVISDVEMPKMTGLELAAKIKSSTRFQHIPVILLTSLGKPEQREAGLRAGANAYLVKSRFDQLELLQTIAGVVAI